MTKSKLHLKVKQKHTWIFRFPSEHRQCDGPLDIFMAIDRWRHAGKYALPYPRVFGKLCDGFHVFVREGRDCHFVVFLGYVVGLDHGGEYRETVGHVQGTVIVVVIGTCQFLEKDSQDDEDIVGVCNFSVGHAQSILGLENLHHSES